MAIIGRESPADIVIPAPQVSARHAEILHVGGDLYQLSDLGSTNGTFVNGRRIQSATIWLTDRVAFGSFEVNLAPYAGLISPPPVTGGGFIPGPPPFPTPNSAGQAPPPSFQEAPAIAVSTPMPVSEPLPPIRMEPTPAEAPMEPVRETKLREADEPAAAPLTPAEEPPKKRHRKPKVRGGIPGCPACGSEEVISLAVLEERQKVRQGSTWGCVGCLLLILLVIVLWPVLLAAGLLGGLMTALGIAGIAATVQENAPIVIGAAVLLAVIIVIAKANAKKWYCERCGKRF